MRTLGIMVVMTFFSFTLASAVTIDLNDGRSVQGDVIKQSDKSLQINVDGVTMTYYADEIKDVDGRPFGAASGPAVQPGAVAQPAAPAQSDAAVQPDAAISTTPVSNSVADTIDPDKKILILKFIDVFGTRQALSSNFELMLKQIEKEKPEEAQKIRQRVNIDEIIERLLPIYDQNFTSDDLKAYITFYGSPEGQKLLSTIPALMKESVAESIKYMEEKFPELAPSK